MKYVGLFFVVGLTACTQPDRWSNAAPTPATSAVEQQEREQATDLTATALTLGSAEQLPPVLPAGPLTLSVEDAIFQALAHNRDLWVQRFEPTIASTFADTERGRYDPELFARFEINRATTTETNRATSSSFDVDRDDAELTAGIRQQLPLGTTIEVAASQRSEDSDRTPEQYESRVGITVTQALLRGFGPKVNMAAIQQAELDAQISLFELRGYAETLLATTERGYWLFVLAERRIAIEEEALRVAQHERDDTAERIAAGAEAASAAAPTQAEVASREQALIEARHLRERRRLELLRLITPHASDGGRSLTVTSKPDLAIELEPQLATRIALAQQQRPELGEARLQLEQQRLSVMRTTDGLRPRLDFFVDLGKTGFGQDLGASIDEIGGPTYDLGFGFDFSMTLGNRSAEARHRARVAERQQARAAISNLEQLVAHEVRLGWNNVERAQQLITATQLSAQLRADSLRAEQERYAAGISTPLQVAQAQRDLVEAETDAAQAAISYRLALVDLFLAEGSLLERRGVSIGPSSEQP